MADNDPVMAITLDQIDQAVADAFSAFHAGESQFSFNGRSYTFRDLDELRRHIQWLRSLKAELQQDALTEAGQHQTPLVEFGEPSA